MAMRGLLCEAEAVDDAALQQILEGYEQNLSGNPNNMVSLLERVSIQILTGYVAYLETSHFGSQIT